MELPPFSATGIGSLPYEEAEPALDLLFTTFPALPHWPQLPRRGAREGMVHQYLHALVTTGLVEVRENKARFATSRPDWPERLTEFYTLALAAEAGDDQALTHFATPPEAAAGFFAFTRALGRRGTDGVTLLKGQIVGPLTAGFALKDEEGKAAYYDDGLRDLTVRTLALAARWQARELASFGRPVLVFIDDPGISVFGQSTYLTVTREMIRDDLDRIIQAVAAAGGRTGLHSCDAVDWSIPFGLPLDVVSLDAYNYFPSLLPYAVEIKGYLARGGRVAWGIVPTFGPRVGADTARDLAALLTADWTDLAERGVPRAALERQAMITPACGTGLLDPAQAEDIYRKTALVARILAEECPC